MRRRNVSVQRPYHNRHRSKYSEEQKQAAAEYYLEHARSLHLTIAALGHPNWETLSQWLDEALPDRRGVPSKRILQLRTELTLEQKREAVVDLDSRDGPAREVAEKYGLTPQPYTSRRTTAREGAIFHADAPSAKWLIDLTKFPPPAGKVYLSPMLCRHGSQLEYQASPSAEMANSMLSWALVSR